MRRGLVGGTMGSTDARSFEVVLLAAAFRNPRGRAYIVEFFPQSVLDLYDIVVAHPDWHATDNLTAKALLVVRSHSGATFGRIRHRHRVVEREHDRRLGHRHRLAVVGALHHI